MPASVLVTGCSSGLGKAVCLELASRKSNTSSLYDVYATSRRKESLESLRQANIHTGELDVADRKSVSESVHWIQQTAGKIDILICNAGIAATAPLVEQDLEDVEQIFQTNTLGVLRCVQAVAPSMIKRQSGRIIIVGSITAALASPFNGAYAASKAALHSMCDTLDMELKPFGVSVTEVWAGTMKTGINAKVADKLECFSKPSSAYYPIAAEIKQRAELLEKEGIMPPEQVAVAIANSLLAKGAPRYITAGSDVRMYNILGFMQFWLCPARISNLLQEKFGLKTLHKQIQLEKKKR